MDEVATEEEKQHNRSDQHKLSEEKARRAVASEQSSPSGESSIQEYANPVKRFASIFIIYFCSVSTAYHPLFQLRASTLMYRSRYHSKCSRFFTLCSSKDAVSIPVFGGQETCAYLLGMADHAVPGSHAIR